LIRRDGSFDGAQAVGIIPLVAEKGFGFDLGDQCVGLGDVVRVAPETERQWIAQRINDDVHIVVRPPRERPMASSQPPFYGEPALCWCALTMVASIIAYWTEKALQPPKKSPLYSRHVHGHVTVR